MTLSMGKWRKFYRRDELLGALVARVDSTRLTCVLIDWMIHRFLEFDRYLEMSYSMSYNSAPGPGPSGNGTEDNDDPVGNDGPSSPSGPTTPSLPTISPSPAKSPTASPTVSPNASPTVSPAPTRTVAPSASITDVGSAASIFECNAAGAVVPVMGTPAAITTPISLSVLYEAESTLNLTDSFLADLELALFSIALNAALNCDNQRRRELFSSLMERKLTTSTTEVGTYHPSLLMMFVVAQL